MLILKKILQTTDNTNINQKLKHTFQNGKTSLQSAVEGGNGDVVELLLQSGADVNVSDEVNRIHRYLFFPRKNIVLKCPNGIFEVVCYTVR